MLLTGFHYTCMPTIIIIDVHVCKLIENNTQVWTPMHIQILAYTFDVTGPFHNFPLQV